MLAPGKYLINPAPTEPTRGTPAGTPQPTPPAPPPAPAEERPSFLLILLRALGAVHT